MNAVVNALADSWRNDVHSRLNASQHQRVIQPDDEHGVAAAMHLAARTGQRLAVCGAQHAMGGQQFAHGGWLLDTHSLCGVRAFDSSSGRIRVGAGTRWPELQQFLITQRDARGHGWAIRQKQTGADDFSLGGSLAANIHGRGLDLPPLVNDIEAFRLVLPSGESMRVDRAHRPELFAQVIGGYGLFGVVTEVELRLRRRQWLQRRVALCRRAELMQAFAQASSEGALYGDFQFAIDPHTADFLDLGVFACYHPIERARPAAMQQQALSAEHWRELLWLAHVDKSEAFRRYSAFYLATDGQHYASDDHQFGVYLDGYHDAIDARLGHVGSEVITELYVPPSALVAFLGEVAEAARSEAMDLIYGTVRLIRRDTETALAWAREDFACVVFNLHVRHDDAGLARLRQHLRRLIDIALGYRGSFYLTYALAARADQLRRAYPQIDAWLAAKRTLDPACVLSSDFHRRLCAVLEAA
jgi:FAD/FMN-containing dehydrogenase